MIDRELLALATPEELDFYERGLVKEKALLSPLDYGLATSPKETKRYAFTEAVNSYVMAVINHALYVDGIGPPAVWVIDPEDDTNGWYEHPERGDEPVQFLLLSAPPQHGKSYLVSELLAPWWLTKFPEKSVILASYEADFAATFGLKGRTRLEEHDEFGVEVDPNTKAGKLWGLKGHRGKMRTAGAGSPINGNPAHIFIIDDPTKNQEEALSETTRRNQKNWWPSTVKTRLQPAIPLDENDMPVAGGNEPGGCVILMSTRWHEDDLFNYVQTTETSVYAVNFPAIAWDGNPDPSTGVARHPETDAPDPLNRRPGEPLVPQRYNRHALEYKKEHGDTEDGPAGVQWFSALYQGEPSVVGGGTFSGPYQTFSTRRADDGRLVYTAGGVETTHLNIMRFITVDLAVSTQTRADWSVFALWGYTTEGSLLLLALERERMEAPDHKDRLLNFVALNTAVHGPIMWIGIEDKTFGTALIQDMQRSGGYMIRPLKADKDKITRATPAGDWNRKGRLFVPHEALWLTDWVNEHNKFPNGTHDDMVDCTAYAVQEAAKMPLVQRQEKRHPVTFEERIAADFDKMDRKGTRRGRHPALGAW